MTILELYNLYKAHPRISTDTRKLTPNSIFFALKGDNFNGNKFAEQALAEGCAYAIIDEVDYQANDRCILVTDVLTTLQELATYHRRQLKIPIIGITGSNGKTTTKELILAALSTQYRTSATFGNLNNHIGVPLTLLSIPTTCEIAVIEMGANHREDIAELARIALPDYGIITNIGKAHLEGFGGLEGVEYAKSRLYEFVRSSDGQVFVNGDNQQLMRLSDGLRQITYGTNSDHFLHAVLEQASPFLKISWLRGKEIVAIDTQILGRYNFENVLAALCIGSFFGISKDNMVQALSQYQSDNNRSQLLEKGTNTILLDAYNANPVSMAAALANFSNWESHQPKLAILGDMFELGEFAEQEHQEIIGLLQSLGFEQALLVGENFAKCELPDSYLSFPKTDEAIGYLQGKKISGHTLLIKGSRGIRLERLLEVF